MRPTVLALILATAGRGSPKPAGVTAKTVSEGTSAYTTDNRHH
jgi:hypothetical protein